MGWDKRERGWDWPNPWSELLLLSKKCIALSAISCIDGRRSSLREEFTLRFDGLTNYWCYRHHIGKSRETSCCWLKHLEEEDENEIRVGEGEEMKRTTTSIVHIIYIYCNTSGQSGRPGIFAEIHKYWRHIQEWDTGHIGYGRRKNRKVFVDYQ